MLTEPWLSKFRAKTEEFEGRAAWMYLDTRGFVTAGIGHLLSTPEDAEALPFSGGMGDVAGLVARDWGAVKAAPPGKLAGFYASLTTSRLSDEAIDSIFEKDITIAWDGMKPFIPALDVLPPPVASAILDMSLNLGAGKLHHDYFGPQSKFGPAIARGDWQAAAAESARRGIQKSRNDYTRDLIMQANGGVIT